MANLRSTKQSPITGPSAGLSGRRRVQVFAFGGLLLVLMNFSGPGAGMIDIPVSFFLKNRMHLQANELAVFKLWVGLPLILGFVFGFIRDRVDLRAHGIDDSELCGFSRRVVRRHHGVQDGVQCDLRRDQYPGTKARHIRKYEQLD